ncbi:M56 family metallopeptidase [Sphingobacterium sp. xlx-130]|uniref:M56 family metallopeptidase n=1 Tax=Sphingobacterium sp. xlx-130 TaxID=2654323 RepID=UPI0013DCDCEF|nr:M56 family metallopeptidase [Sphingobacterium sp. xlx-130]
MIYLLLVNIAMGIGFGLYHLCFRKLTFFQWNRVYLLGIVMVPLLIPIGLFVDLSGFSVEEQILPVVNLEEVIDVDYIPYASDERSYRLLDMLSIFYWVGVFVGVLLLTWRLRKVRKAFHFRNEYTSFSFFRKVFLGSKVQNEKMIGDHEQVHVDQGHSYDILLVEIVSVLNWFSPIVYLIRKELKFQHECIADEICSQDKVAYAELLVAHAMRTNPSHLVHGFSNHSFLKKRIMMLFKNKSSNKNKLFYLAGIPVLLIVVCSTLIFNTSRARAVVADIESKIVDADFLIGEQKSGTIFNGKSEVFVIQDTLKKGGKIREVENSQEKAAVILEGSTELFESVEIQPEPPGGMVAFRRWIAENYQYPKSALDAAVKGIVLVSFIVEKDGALSDLKITKDIGHDTGDAAVRLLSKSARWSPGVQNGTAVRVAYVLPIRLDLTAMGQQKKIYRAKPEIGYDRLQDWLVVAYKSPRKLTSDDLDPYMSATFDVASDGSLSNFAVRSELDEDFKSRFVNLLKNTKWIPEEEDGIKQKSRAWVGLNLAGNGAVRSNNERVEVSPEPKGGMKQFMTSVANKINFPAVLKSLKHESTLVELGFDVLPSGELGNFKVLIEAHAGIANDVISAAKSYGLWNPGIIDGKRTVTSYILPVQYSIVDGEGHVRISGLRGGNMRVSRTN